MFLVYLTFNTETFTFVPCSDSGGHSFVLLTKHICNVDKRQLIPNVEIVGVYVSPCIEAHLEVHVYNLYIPPF